MPIGERPSEAALRRRLIERQTRHEASLREKGWASRAIHRWRQGPRAGAFPMSARGAPGLVERLRRRPISAFFGGTVLGAGVLAVASALFWPAPPPGDAALPGRVTDAAPDSPVSDSAITDRTESQLPSLRRQAATAASRPGEREVAAVLRMRLPDYDGQRSTGQASARDTITTGSVPTREDLSTALAALRGASGLDPQEPTEAGPPTDPARAEAAESTSAAATVARITASVNLRAGPENDAAVVAVLKAGTPVDLLSCQSWCRIRAGERSGYVYERFVDRTSP